MRRRQHRQTETLEPKGHKQYLRTLLYPGRFYYSWMTGLIGSNDDAVAFLNERHPARLDVSLIGRALQCRQTAADPHALFPARTTLLRQIDACAAAPATFFATLPNPDAAVDPSPCRSQDDMLRGED
jgi:hypothetical protein